MSKIVSTVSGREVPKDKIDWVMRRHAKDFCEAVQYGKQFRIPEASVSQKIMGIFRLLTPPMPPPSALVLGTFFRDHGGYTPLIRFNVMRPYFLRRVALSGGWAWKQPVVAWPQPVGCVIPGQKRGWLVYLYRFKPHTNYSQVYR